MSDKEPPDRGRPLSNLSNEGNAVSFSDAIDDSLFSPSQSDIGINNNRKRMASSIFSSPRKTKNPGDNYQNVYISPEYDPDDPQLKYRDTDKGPFLVHITKTEPDLSSGVSLQVLKVAQLLHKYNVQAIVEGSIKSVGRNKIAVNFKSALDANNFLSVSFLSENKLSASIPRYHVSRMGVVRDIPTEWSLEELVEGMHFPSGLESEFSGRVIKARRLSRKIHRDGQPPEWIPSKTVVLTFHSQALPEKIFVYNSSIPVYTYSLPSIQCRKCCRFGHIAAKCRSKPICYRCAQPHPGESCSIPDDNSSCVLCLGRHIATDQSCPEHARQKAIKVVMSEENIGYMEASQRFRPARMSYSAVAQKAASPPQRLTTSLPPIPNYVQVDSSLSTQKSYRKTIFSQRKPRRLQSQMYDVRAHNEITREPCSSLPNGCALNNNVDESPNDNFLDHLTGLLVNLIHKFSDSLPNNVRSQLQSIVPLITDNGHSSMECSEFIK